MFCLVDRKTERVRQTDRQTETETERQRETETERRRKTETDRGRDRDRTNYGYIAVVRLAKPLLLTWAAASARERLAIRQVPSKTQLSLA